MEFPFLLVKFITFPWAPQVGLEIYHRLLRPDLSCLGYVGSGLPEDFRELIRSNFGSGTIKILKSAGIWWNLSILASAKSLFPYYLHMFSCNPSGYTEHEVGWRLQCRLLTSEAKMVPLQTHSIPDFFPSPQNLFVQLESGWGSAWIVNDVDFKSTA